MSRRGTTPPGTQQNPAVTGLYYLQSRYYNPQIGRFISADAFTSTGQGLLGNNMFAYCNNNPVCNYDPNGELAISLTVLGLIVGATLGAVIGGVAAYNAAEDSGAEGWELVGWTALGALGGGIIGGAVGAGIGAAITNATRILGFSIVKGNVFTVTQTMVLGHRGYTALASSLGYGYYQISTALYNGMTDIERWAMNSQFLNDCYNLGANFIVEPSRVIAQYGTKYGSWLYHEIQFLLDKGYLWLEDLSALVR